MALNINSNSFALGNQRQLNRTSSSLSQAFNRASTGLRINRASDDAAGLAISERLTANIATAGQVARGISDAFSALDIAQTSISSSSEIATRINQLATQAANGTLSDSQRASINEEFQALRSELDRINSSTEFNGQPLLGSTISVKSGTGTGDDAFTDVSVAEVSSSSLGLDSIDLSTQEGAQQALATTTAAVETIAASQAPLGAAQARLEASFNNISQSRLSETEALSRIQDADIATEAANIVSNQIRQQIGVALQAQSSTQNRLALDILK